MRYLLCLFFVMSSVWAQPDFGPYVIAEGESLPSCGGVKLLPPIEDNWQVFYSFGDSAYHLQLNIATGETAQLIALPGSEAGWGRRLCDAVWTEDSSWSVLCYDTTLDYNRTNLISNRNEGFQSVQIDSGRNWWNEWFGASVHSFSFLKARPNGGVFAGWVDSFFDWYCATVGAAVLNIPPNETNFYPDYSCPEADWDSRFLIIPVDSASYFGISGYYGGQLCFAENHNTYWAVVFNSEIHPAQLLKMANGHFIVLSEPGWQVNTRIVELDSSGYCESLNSFESNVISSASHPDYGFAWIDQVGRGLRLWRADLNGQPVATEGLIHHHDAYTIDKINLNIADDGTIAVIWCESYANSRTIRACAVNWETPLSADGLRLVPHPESFTLSAYPNPFNSTVKLSYELPVSGDVSLSIYNLAGQKVATIVDDRVAAGTYEVSWTPEVASGVYFAQLNALALTKTAKLLYLK
ncbi:T9SS C-terminal target domain-containing protein [bacterium]|nr:MAG: T9SS C-terminal target domain-containing protein [bacterium]